MPCMTEDIELTAESSPVPLVYGRGETILVVEDNTPLRRVATRQLRELGYRVLQAENAAAGLKLMERERVNLLLTDIVMPGGIDGRELARRTRQRWPRTNVVFTSGFSEVRLNDGAPSQAPGTPVLSKPYRKEELANAVREALDRAVRVPIAD
jgi:CheY-like chemotaxis protein